MFQWGAETILSQTWGIAMGTPPAPSNAITVAAFMELKWHWMVSQDAWYLTDRTWTLAQRFISSRFMDDTATAVAY